LEAKECTTPLRNLKDLRAFIMQAWEELSEDYIVKTYRAFRPRIEAMMALNGKHFE
jgi:hypothetical protein